MRKVVWTPNGFKLDIDVDEDLSEIFGDPCPGVFKV